MFCNTKTRTPGSAHPFNRDVFSPVSVFFFLYTDTKNHFVLTVGVKARFGLEVWVDAKEM